MELRKKFNSQIYCDGPAHGLWRQAVCSSHAPAKLVAVLEEPPSGSPRERVQGYPGIGTLGGQDEGKLLLRLVSARDGRDMGGPGNADVTGTRHTPIQEPPPVRRRD